MTEKPDVEALVLRAYRILGEAKFYDEIQPVTKDLLDALERQHAVVETAERVDSAFAWTGGRLPEKHGELEDALIAQKALLAALDAPKEGEG